MTKIYLSLSFLSFFCLKLIPPLYRVSPRRTVAAALLQATSLPFIAAASQIGVELGIITPGVAAALVGAGLASVLLFPAAAVALLRPAADPTPHTTPILGGTR